MLTNGYVRLVARRRIPRLSYRFRHSRLQLLHIGGHVLFDQQPLVVVVTLINIAIVDVCERNAVQSMPHALEDPTLHSTVK